MSMTRINTKWCYSFKTPQPSQSMARNTSLLTLSIPHELAEAFDKLAPNRQKSAIICQLIREWMRTEVGFAEIDTQVELAQAKVDELAVTAELFHEAQANLERLNSLKMMDKDVVKASEELKEESLARLKLSNDIEDTMLKQSSDRAWLNLVYEGKEKWADGSPGYMLYHNKENGDHTIVRYHSPTSEKDWGTTDLHEIKKMTTKGNLPWIENCEEDCKQYKLKQWKGESLPEYLLPFMQEKSGLVSWKPYTEDKVYFVKRIVDVESLPDSDELSILKNKTTYETASLEDK